jgi:hypothetical protein|tara:strand:+ start:1743 stop:2348 length:606 start_codon:yes stop_codon:yes gene_type:complete
MTSNVDIANGALNILGASNISAFDENSKAARLVNQRYNAIRDAVFAAHPWNCLIKRAELAQSSTIPAFGYEHEYPLPTDPFCLRVLEFSNGTMGYPQDNMHNASGGPVFVIEGRNLVTDEDTVKIKYVARITDPQQYDPGLIEVLSTGLATSICYAITGSSTMVSVTEADFNKKLRSARFIDSTQGAPQRIEASDFIESRF